MELVPRYDITYQYTDANGTSGEAEGTFDTVQPFTPALLLLMAEIIAERNSYTNVTILSCNPVD